jgi:predicted peptidase
MAVDRVFARGWQGGYDNLAQINSNIDNLLAEAKRRGAFLYAPQSPGVWNDKILTDLVITMVDRAEAAENIDPQRLYITGLSNGGGGVWSALSRYPNEFAAAVPLAGIPPDDDFRPTNLVHQSIWAFHAQDDGTVSISTSRSVISSILAAAG